jgi:outer membrane protein
MGLVALLALVASVPAFAELKIGYVDFQRLAEESPQAKTLRDSLQGEFGPKQRELQALQQSGKARQEKLQKDAPTMSEEQRARGEKDIRDAQREFERKSAEFQDDLNARRNEEMQRLQRALIEEVRTYAKAQNFDLIVTEGSTIYAAPPLDITANVLAALQARGGSQPPKPASGASSSSKSK